MFDTIAAIATPKGEGGIGIIRISGDEALNILDQIFVSNTGKTTKELRNFSLNYGNIIYKNELIDEVIVGIMKAPNSFTRENTVEINCHGGYLITEKILEIVLKSGARLGENGEFTKRAFINGRIDLTQAEAVIDLIRSKTEKNITLSMEQLRGELKEKIKYLKKLLFDVTAHVNVIIDYPEEGIEEPLPENLINNVILVKKTIEKLIRSYESGKKIKEGIKTSIVGRPNVGKSSLLNALLREERAIVTHIPGTTRDVIEEVVNIKGFPLVLIDTAGIRETEDYVEKIGIEKSRESIEKSDLILFVIDGSEQLTNEDFEIDSFIDKKDVILIINKIDNKVIVDLSKIKNKSNLIEVSAKEFHGIEDLEEYIYNHIVSSENEYSNEKIVITNIRHKTALERTKNSIENILETINNKMPMDLIAVDLKEALDALSEITGEITSEHILDHIFKNFCVGK